MKVFGQAGRYKNGEGLQKVDYFIEDVVFSTDFANLRVGEENVLIDVDGIVPVVFDFRIDSVRHGHEKRAKRGVVILHNNKAEVNRTDDTNGTLFITARLVEDIEGVNIDVVDSSPVCRIRLFICYSFRQVIA